MTLDTGTLNFAWSRQLAAGFSAAGVRAAVLSPGSRSTPLALALLRQPGMDCRVVVDERSAAFVALGIAKAGGVPVLLLATSGTGPANWLPAVAEADRGGVPLILLSADRPPELHGWGANQTVDQLDFFARHVRARHALGAPHPDFDPGWLHRLAARATEEASWPRPGPVHINQPFREPLLPVADLPPPEPLPAVQVSVAPAPPDPAAIASLAKGISGRPGAIVCGEGPYPPGFARAVAALAARLACPILAEPLSGLRFGPHDRARILCRYEGWLRHQAFVRSHRPEWLLRFGAYPVTRTLQGFGAGAPTLALADPRPSWNDPAHGVTHLLRADPPAVCEALAALPLRPAPRNWLADFLAAEEAVPPTGSGAPWEAQLVPALLSALPAHCPVFVGNSMAIRDLDAFSGQGAEPREFFANRGLSGIDGNVSTALGIAAARGRVVALLGDLTCQHDIGGFAAARGMNAVFVVFNNGGGGIFDHLPQAGLPEFEAGWLTPQAIDFSAAAATFGLAYSRAAAPGELAAAVTDALAGGHPTLVEVPIDRAASLASRRQWLAGVAAAPLPSQPVPDEADGLVQGES